MKDYLYYYFDPKSTLINNLSPNNPYSHDSSVIRISNINYLLTAMHNIRIPSCLLFNHDGLADIESHFNEINKMHNVQLILLNDKHDNYLSITPANWEVISLIAENIACNPVVDLTTTAINYSKAIKRPNKKKANLKATDNSKTNINNQQSSHNIKPKAATKPINKSSDVNPDITVDLPKTDKTIKVANDAIPLATNSTIEETSNNKNRPEKTMSTANETQKSSETVVETKPTTDAPQKIVFGNTPTATKPKQNSTPITETEQTTDSNTDNTSQQQNITDDTSEPISDQDFLAQAVHPNNRSKKTATKPVEAPNDNDTNSEETLSNAMKTMDF